MSTDDLLAFVKRYQVLEAQRVSAGDLVKDLLIYCESVQSDLGTKNELLARRVGDLELDLADATKSRREMQNEIRMLQHQLGYLTQDHRYFKDRSPYVVVLVDGDGLLFKESFVRQCVEGGKKAAYRLRGAIAGECGAHSDEIEVVCRVYANLSGLARLYKRSGVVEHESDLREFFMGFTQGLCSFDFVDVGYGKERPDAKIREATRWHLRNVNCKQVVLGVSHDPGYAPLLKEIMCDEESRLRITVLEGTPTVRELLATDVNILNLNDEVFRAKKLVELPGYVPLSPTTTASFPTPSNGSSVSSVPPGAPSLGAAGPTAVAATATYAGIASSASPPPTLNLPFKPKPPAGQNSNHNNNKNTITTTNKKSLTGKSSPWNPGPRGLDNPIIINQAVLDKVKKRRDRDKLCNNHYLRGPCMKRDICSFEHKYKPTAEEKIAIAFLARLNPCTKGQDCDIDDCIYGHHCPSVKEGYCTNPYCKFRPEEHPPNTKFKSTYAKGEY